MSLMLRRAGDRINRRTGRISNGYLRLLRDLSPRDAVAETGMTPAGRMPSARNRHFEAEPGPDAHAIALREAFLLDLVPFAPGDHIVEIGANVGDFAQALQTFNMPFDLTCFEPAPREFRALSRNLANATSLTARARQAAVWNADADAVTLYRKAAGAEASLLPMEDYDSTTEVPAIRLDSVLERRPYRLLKLDAKGAEPEILDGAEGILDCFQYITADVGFERGPRQDSTLPEVSNHLISRGWRARAVGRRRMVVLFENPKWGN